MRIGAILCLLFGVSATFGQTPSGFVLVAHGGAGDYSQMLPQMIEARRQAMITAIREGYKVLERGGLSIDAVEATIRVMEDSGQFDAGRGAYYSKNGEPEMDAAIMNGQTREAGSVASVKRIANPIHLARLVMEKTPHVLLVGEGAEEFAKSQGIDLVSPYYFYNDREWKRFQDADKMKKEFSGPGTVGVVALDQSGNLAAGTSTGGTVWKMPGRVGDSPIIGAGTYANNESCAVSATGVGEYFMRNVVAFDICARIRYMNQPLQQAADEVIKELTALHGDGGVIALDRSGNYAMPYNTKGMITGVVQSGTQIMVSGWDPSAAPMLFPVK